MPKKIMQFFKKPSSILAILLAVALLGTGSLYALKAFAYGEIDVIPAELLSENFDVVTVDHVFVYNIMFSCIIMNLLLFRYTVPSPVWEQGRLGILEDHLTLKLIAYVTKMVTTYV